MLLGTLVFLLIIIGIVIAILIIKRRGASEKCQRRLNLLKKKIFFNPIVRYMILNCLKLSISGTVALKAAALAGDGSIVLPLMVIALVSLTPLAFVYVMFRNKERLDREDFRERYGSMYGGKNVYNERTKAYLYPMLYFWRRLIFAIITVYLFPYPLMQLLVHHFMTMLSVILLVSHKRAFDTQA